jgi:hypothetical protein
MLYAFGPRRGRLMHMGITAEEVQQLFRADLRLLRVEEGADPNGPAAAWYWLKRI